MPPDLLYNLFLTACIVLGGTAVLAGCFYVWAFSEITLHELAHVLVGRLVGFRPYVVTVGKGRLLIQKQVGSVKVLIHARPSGGSTMAHLPDRPDLWWRGFLYASAGLVSDGLLLYGLLVLKRHWALDERPFVKIAAMLASGAVLYQWMMILMNAWPQDFNRQGRVIPSDGRQIFRYVTGSTTRALKALPEIYLKNIRRYDPGFTLEDSWFKKAEKENRAIFLEIEAYRACGNHKAAAEKYLSLLNHPNMTKGERAMLLDSLASVALVQGNDMFLERSLQWAKEAYELFPASITLRGTYGAALVESGEYAAGIAMLTPLTTDGNEVHDREISSCYLAKAHAFLGDDSQAQAWLEKGGQSGTYYRLVWRIEDQVRNRQTPAKTASS